MFEKASRLKLRFEYKGLSSVEDLWDLTMVALDGIYKNLKADEKNRVEESLMSESGGDDVLALKIEIVKHIFAAKKAEAEARKTAADKRQQKARIKEILAQKQDATLLDKSEEELLKMLEEE